VTETANSAFEKYHPMKISEKVHDYQIKIIFPVRDRFKGSYKALCPWSIEAIQNDRELTEHRQYIQSVFFIYRCVRKMWSSEKRAVEKKMISSKYDRSLKHSCLEQ
jgi:hypothetical protein